MNICYRWHVWLRLTLIGVLAAIVLPAPIPVLAQSNDVSCAERYGGSLVGYWGFDAADPMQPLYGDIAGQIVGPLGMASGIVGQALEFNGNGYVNYGTTLDIPAWNSYTVSIWFYNDGRVAPVKGYGQKIIDKTTWFSDWFLGVPNNPDQVTPRSLVFMYDRDFENMQTAGYDYIDSQWHHALVTRNGTHGELWVDGVLIDAKENINGTVNSQPLLLGYSLSGDGYQQLYWGGYLDEFAVFDRALSATEIAALYAISAAGQPYCEPEDALVVNSVADPGDGVCDAQECTLREAINAANERPGKDTVTFQIPGRGPHTIVVASALPAITDAIVIDGYSQPGAVPANTAGSAKLQIELNGARTPTGTSGLVISGGNSQIQGLSITEFALAGIELLAPGQNIIRGNHIGIGPYGLEERGNASPGIRIDHSNHNLIGGPTQADRNIIAANGDDGISMGESDNNTIQGNFIGISGSGAAAPNDDGILIRASYRTLVKNNIIAFNRYPGVRIIYNSLYNRVTTNAIYNNGELGIALDLDGVTTNDPGDSDGGTNLLQNFPVLEAAATELGTVTVLGTLNSRPNDIYTIEFFTSRTCDPSGHGEGEFFLGTSDIATNSNGDAHFALDLAQTPPGDNAYVTATATDRYGNTSEFAACRPLLRKLNQQLRLLSEPVQAYTTFDPTPNPPYAPAGTLTIHAEFQSISRYPLRDIFFQVTTLTGGNVIMNAAGEPSGVGAVIQAATTVPAQATFTVDFVIGLAERKVFDFLVDAYGFLEGGVSSATVSPSSNAPSFHFVVPVEQIEGNSTSKLYLPIVAR